MPYRFLDSEKHEKTLISTIENCGYEFKNKVKSYREESINFNRVWHTFEVFTIKWKREFVADGTDEQDSQVVLAINEDEVGIIDVDCLLRSKLDTTLNEEIISKIIKIVKAHNKG